MGEFLAGVAVTAFLGFLFVKIRESKKSKEEGTGNPGSGSKGSGPGGDSPDLRHR